MSELSEYDIKRIAREVVKQIEENKKPKCEHDWIITSDWAGGTYCRKCGKSEWDIN